MAPVAGKPFLQYLISYLLDQGVEKFIFSLGYKHEVIEDFLLKNYPFLHYQISVETEPLGTGGAIRLGCKKAGTRHLLVLNGDTMYKVDVKKMFAFHLQHNASCTLALKPMHEFERYGVVEINQFGCIQSFKEKKYYQQGLINGGVYALDVAHFLELEFPEKFSFEKDYLEKYYSSRKMMGLVQDAYFIDIGIPEDFEKAQQDMSNF